MVESRHLRLIKQELMQRLRDRENRIKELERSNLEMKTDLKSLPYSRTPEQIRGDYESHHQAKKEMMRLLIELKNAGCLSFFKRRRIIKELIEYI
ncbi:hypothetical protein PITCH_A1430027 [uncultured Desulfobacterium sp.]|uniref:Uncharacterized protein n=1 Tax=uncultured Desulfobacterium sp. TaxID=201089 RepID=A0A445MT73_9BACT|nr:hypothetical protein PITCH_A1430027 [uncultured Desulfobacterium sp.]